MPKKWVRDARRKAREESYRSVSAEQHATIREETKNPERAPFPVHRYGPILWREASTISTYLNCLLGWVDDARDYVFTGQYDPQTLSMETLSNLSALRLAATSWVIRSSKVKIVLDHKEAFYKNDTPQFFSGLFAVVSTRITNVGKTSLETEHEIRIVHPKSPRQFGELVAIVSGTMIVVDNLKPLEISENVRQYLIKNVLVPGMLPSRFDFPTPNPKQQLHETRLDMTVRKSDCDGLGHVNNCKAINFFTEMVDEEFLKQTRFFVIEYPDSLYPGNSGEIVGSSWIEEEELKKFKYWLGEFQFQNKVYLKAYFSTKPGKEISEDEDDDDDDDDEKEDNKTGLTMFAPPQNAFDNQEDE